VSDLYNDPMDQLAEQVRLTVAALRERQELELLHDPDIGLLHRADPRQRLYPRTGPPTPDDLDELLSRRRRTHFLLAHPRTIAAFGRECTRRGICPSTVAVHGRPAAAWRGVPLLPCDKIPISANRTTAILALRTGEQHQGVIGLHQTGLPGEHEPGVSVRRSGVDGKGIASYQVSAYYSVSVLVPDALGILEELEVGT
jgi:Phage capsid-like protein